MFDRKKFKAAIDTNDYKSALVYIQRVKRKQGLKINLKCYESNTAKILNLLKVHGIPHNVSFNIHDVLDAIIPSRDLQDVMIIVYSDACQHALYRQMGDYHNIKHLFMEKVFNAKVYWPDMDNKLSCVDYDYYNECCIKYGQFNKLVLDRGIDPRCLYGYLVRIEDEEEFQSLVNILLHHNKDLSYALHILMGYGYSKSKFLIDNGVMFSSQQFKDIVNTIHLLKKRKNFTVASTVGKLLEYYCIKNNLLYPGKQGPETIKWQDTCVTCQKHIWYAKVLLTPCKHIMCSTCATNRAFCTACNTEVLGNYYIPSK